MIINRILSRKRFDDNIETLKKRIISYEQETLPVIDYLSKISNVIKIDGNADEKCINKRMINSLKYLL